MFCFPVPTRNWVAGNKLILQRAVKSKAEARFAETELTINSFVDIVK